MDLLRRGRAKRLAAAQSRLHVASRRNRQRQLSRKRRVLRVLLLAVAVISFVGAIVSGGIFAAYQSYLAQLPNAAQLASAEPPLDTHVYASNGELIAILTAPDAASRHEHAELDQISSYLIDATVDVEDRHFWSEGSFDLPRIAESAISDLRHSGATQGASTITEQLAKVVFLPDTQTIDRKIKQVILGEEIDASFSKSQILDMYLNRIDYGNHSTGIATAADLYFHIPAADLDLAQASMLAGLPQSPTTDNPLIHTASQTANPLAKQRQLIVLQAMVTNGDITQPEAHAAYKEPLTFYSWTDVEVNLYPDFTQYLETYLNENFGDAYLDPGGWNIDTTLNIADQTAAESSVTSVITANYARYNDHDGALVAINPSNGDVEAMVGTWDYTDPADGDVNMAVQPRQPGSSIKLFTYSAAIASRQYTMATTLYDTPVTYTFPGGGTYRPTDYSLTFSGPCPLKKCFLNSLNVPAVKVEVSLGIPYITDLEIDTGLTGLANPDNRPSPYNYSATLGALTVGVSPLDMADAAATIADMGVHHDPTPIVQITDALTNQTLWTDNPAASARQVIPPDVAFIISEITSNDANRQPEFPANGPLTLPNRRVSAKTGTTQFYTDNWTVGWTPQLVSAVWVGNPTPSCLQPQDTATMAHDLAVDPGRLNYSGANISDPFSPQDLALYHLTPINDACGHLVGSDGLTGAAPIWNSFMKAALSGLPQVWYQKPADVIEVGSGDNGDFYLPGTISQSAATTPVGGEPPGANGAKCWYYAPAAQPGDSCAYLGPG